MMAIPQRTQEHGEDFPPSQRWKSARVNQKIDTVVSDCGVAVQVPHHPTEASREAWPERPHSQTWEHEGYGYNGHEHWEEKLGRIRGRRILADTQ